MIDPSALGARWLGSGAVIAFFILLVTFESLAPRRAQPRARRWLVNLELALLNNVLLRLAFPLTLIALAEAVHSRGAGLLAPLGDRQLVGVGAFVLLDLSMYLQHVMFHAVPAFWRLHLVHHSDRSFDATTGVRFHPLEMGLSFTVKAAVITALGPPAVAVAVFEGWLLATSLFNHANVHIPGIADRWLRQLVVTPDMHRVHHSAKPRETNRNFGFGLPWWDRLFGTYLEGPSQGHEAMAIGSRHPGLPAEESFARILALPFRSPVEGGEAASLTGSPT